MTIPLASYPLLLLTLMKEDNESFPNPLGTAERMPDSSFKVPAHRLLLALLEHSPSPDTIAREFLVELRNCGTPAMQESGANSLFNLR
jgi:hypothetical protein